MEPQPTQPGPEAHPPLAETPLPPTKHVHHLWSFIVLGFFLILSLSLVGFIIVSPQQTSETKVTITKPTPTASDPTANWKTYSNQLYGFSFKYPSEWAYENEKNSSLYSNPAEVFLVFGVPAAIGKTTVSKSIDTELTLQVFKANPNDASLQVFLNNFGFSICNELNSEKGKPYVMDGKPGYLFEKTTCVPEIMMSYLFVTNGIDMYKISIRNPLFVHSLLSTFRFTDQSQTIDTSNWKTYTASDFSLKYPQEIKTSQYQGEYVFELWGSTQKEGTEFHDGINIGITTENLNGQTLMDLTNKAQEASKENLGSESVSDVSENVVTNYKGYQYTANGLGTMKYIFVSNGTNKYAKIRYLLNTDPQNKGYQKTIDQILSTFKFTQ